jgi:hypothetical protein
MWTAITLRRTPAIGEFLLPRLEAIVILMRMSELGGGLVESNQASRSRT